MTSNETDQQTIDGLKTAKPQPTNHHNFYIPWTNLITTKPTNQNQDHRHKYHHLTTTLHLTLKMTIAQVVETSVTNKSLSKDYLHPDDHNKPITESIIGSSKFPGKCAYQQASRTRRRQHSTSHTLAHSTPHHLEILAPSGEERNNKIKFIERLLVRFQQINRGFNRRRLPAMDRQVLCSLPPPTPHDRLNVLLSDFCSNLMQTLHSSVKLPLTFITSSLRR